MKHILLLISALGFSLPLSSQNRLYVNHAATGGNTGQTWADAFADLQQALALAQAGDEIWVAAGAYLPTSDANRDSSFHLRSGVRLYGGFVGTETLLAQRDWAAHPVLLSGDIGAPGDSTDNSYTILYMENPDSATVLDGFTFRHGIANYSTSDRPANHPSKCGGAIYMMGFDGWAYASVRNCRFERNYAYTHGGAVYINGGGIGSVAPQFVGCVFEENRARLDGGGLYRSGGSWAERSPDLDGCQFRSNSAARRGGGLCFSESERTDQIDLWHCDFVGNTSTQGGGGAAFLLGRNAGSKLRLKGCFFTQNSDNHPQNSSGEAVGLFSFSFKPTQYVGIDTCTFTDNSPGAVVFGDALGGLFEMKATKTEYTPLAPLGMGFANFAFDLSSFDTVNIASSIFFFETYGGPFLLRARFRIEGNKFINKTYSSAFLEKGYGNGVVLNNVFFSKENSILELFSFDSSTGGGTFIEMVGNTIVANEQQENFMDMPGSECKINIRNNVILASAIKIRNEPSDNSEITFDHCMLSPTDFCATAPAFVTCGPGNLFGLDPMFRDTANGDYSLLPCSPLINAGSNPAAANIPTDLAGNPRILGGTVDIGAYESPAFALAASPTVLPACAGASNGSISVSPVFGCEPYTYQWQPSVGDSSQLSNLSPGSYLLTVTDGSGRQVFDTVAVPLAPVPVLSLAAQDLLCGTGAGGSISATVSDGTPPFHYSWLPATLPDTSHLALLPPGNYALKVLDANGCQDSAQALVALVGSLTPMVGGAPISCHSAADGRLSAMPANGAAPFSWLWQGWAGTDSIAQPLGPGNYSVTVSDAYGCTFSFDFQPLIDPDSLWLTAGHTNNTDMQMPNGTAVVTTTSGGTPFQSPPPPEPPVAPYNYVWSTGGMEHFITGLPAETYTVTVTDSRGCTATTEVTVQFMVGTGEAAEGHALLMYPNPAADWLKIVLPAHLSGQGGQGNLEGKWLAELADASGRVLLREWLPAHLSSHGGQAGAGDCTLDLSGLPGGAYTVTVRNEGAAMFVGKVVKK